ncbi:aspartate dehydrogenase [Pontibaca salina]|uniref:L-aspartate dehydrogenase n=1 Tax=Pontibaca salina TaxID=2795731 RepID=A0A934HLA6_9RHOB|nr:aspartate dehydrogenase [Pontibaca salina]MBI6628966.1 aspartate dehydrogenase [Pontibaca salina]
MTLNHLCIIGAGSIAAELLDTLAHVLEAPLERLIVLQRAGKTTLPEDMAQAASRCAITVQASDNLADVIAARPDLAIECAGHGAVHAYGEQLLENGIETVIASTGVLADDAWHDRLRRAAQAGQTRLVLPAGAVGGMDILAALQNGTLDTVAYTSRKPPHAWRGSPAEAAVDLDSLTGETVFFEGSARRAAVDYPQNANVAATIALAGAGLDATTVRMIADPDVQANIHQIEIASDGAEVQVRIVGKPTARNPKTSLPTVYSLVREVMRRRGPIVS